MSEIPTEETYPVIGEIIDRQIDHYREFQNETGEDSAELYYSIWIEPGGIREEIEPHIRVLIGCRPGHTTDQGYLPSDFPNHGTQLKPILDAIEETLDFRGLNLFPEKN